MWAEGIDEPYGFRVSGVNENATNTWRRYRSANYATDAAKPKLSVTWTEPVSTPSGPTIVDCGDSCTEDLDVPTLENATPTFSSKAVNPSGAAVNFTWEVREAGSKSPVASATTSAASGVPSTWTVPAGKLEDGWYYEARVTATAGASTKATRWLLFATSFPITEDVGLDDPEDDIESDADEAASGDVDGASGFRVTHNRLRWRADGGTATPDSPAQIGNLAAARATAGDDIPYNGWAPCPLKADKDIKKVMKRYKRKLAYPEPGPSVVQMRGSYGYLNCGKHGGRGSGSYGFRHIGARHQDQFQQLASLVGRQWRDIAGWMMNWTLKDPDRITWRAGNPGSRARFCYSRKFTLVDENNNDAGVSTYMTIIMGATGRKMITAFPTSNGQYCSRSTNFRPNQILH